MVNINTFNKLPATPGMEQGAVASAGGNQQTDWRANVLDALVAQIAVLDRQGLIVTANRAWTRFAEENDSRPRDHEVGMNYLDSVRARAEQGDVSAVHSLVGLAAVLSGQKPRFELEYPRHGTDQERWFLMQVTPLPDVGGCVVAHIDITTRKQAESDQARRRAVELQEAYEELKRTQEQLVQSEKMASLGQLAAGVAHEINNPIGYLSSNLSTLGGYVRDVLGVVETHEAALSAVTDPAQLSAVAQKKQEVDFAFLREDIPTLLTESLEGIQRVRKIVQDLKDFAHAGDNEDWQWVDLRHSLRRTLNIVNNELKYKAEVRQDYQDIPEIHCLPGQLNQVFMNLLVNAGHAIEANGEVLIHTRQEGEWISVEISDTGCGMPQEVISRIFDPFFTTKPVGKGTGLGLSISYGIVKKHGGRIEVGSKLGEGTTFRVLLPVAGPDPLATEAGA